ncbi:MAG: hypothetical protein PHX78_02260 [bacterium]|nr:hypothetical protein [bacterium]
MKKYFIFLIIIFFSSANLAAEELVKKDVLLPEKFLTNKILGKRMLFSDEKDVFLTYIFFLRNFKGNAKGRVETDYKKIKEYLYPDITAKKANKNILKILDILYEKYELIEFDRNLKEDPEIKLLSLMEDRLPYKYPALDYLAIPETLWSFGWEKRLSFTGLYIYLINLMEFKLTPFDTHWSIDPDMLALKYNLSLRQMQQGLEELQQYGLLEAQAADENNIFTGKPAIKYNILPLYSWKNAEIQWKNLEANNKKKDIERASKYAAILYKRYDPNMVEEILKLMKQFPPRKLKKAFDIVDEKPVASEERSLSYLRKILDNI